MAAGGDRDGELSGDGGAAAGGGPDLELAAEGGEPVGHVPLPGPHRGVAHVVAGPVVGHGEPQGSVLRLKADLGAGCVSVFGGVCSASRQQKYAAASMSLPNRPMPPASTVTGSGELAGLGAECCGEPQAG
jgi:hypothetical protein